LRETLPLGSAEDVLRGSERDLVRT
jgi:hypothetical protein